MATASAPQIEAVPTPEPRVYPNLVLEYRRQLAVGLADEEGQDLRLNRVSRTEAELRQERDARQRLYKKYGQ